MLGACCPQHWIPLVVGGRCACSLMVCWAPATPHGIDWLHIVHMWGVRSPPVIDNRWSWEGYVHGVFAPADAACLVRLRHPRWGVPCVRPCEPYRLLDNEQPCDWNRTRELRIRLSGHAGWLSLAESGLEPMLHPNSWHIAQGGV